MRKLILEAQLTIDGFFADINGKNDWQVWNWGPEWNWDDELKNYATNLMMDIDCILLSRKMAKEGFISHWLEAAESSTDPRYSYAKKINEMHKVVFSKTLQKSEWDNTDLAKGELADEINRLKSQEGKDLIVYGGATFVSALIMAGLIDEFQLFINPTAIGNGFTIFNGLDSRLNLTLITAKSYECGMVVLVYKKKQV